MSQVYMRYVVTGGSKLPIHGGVKCGAVEDFIVWGYEPVLAVATSL
jgi:hypothetical protein